MKKITQELNELVSRSFDSNIKIAITGLSRSGKTAFITSLVNQLLHTSTHDNLPLLKAMCDKRIVGAKRCIHTNVMVPRFDYDTALEQLQANPAKWPQSTSDISEIRMAVKYYSTKRYKKFFSKTSMLTLDIIDYPGEWLLDLPLLEMDFKTWSSKQFELLKHERLELAQSWLDKLKTLDLSALTDEKKLEDLAKLYTQYLHKCKKFGFNFIQPGRFILPSDLDGAPVLHFFPVMAHQTNYPKDSNFAMLEKRYNQYRQKIVKKFYRDHFATFDRQIVLVDCLQLLNMGSASFNDTKQALQQILQSFNYGQRNILQRLFTPKIDKVLFAATKADHVTSEQHRNLSSLLKNMVQSIWQRNAYENIEMESMSIASIAATKSGFITKSDNTKQAVIQGVDLNGKLITIFAGEVPSKIPESSYWDDNKFEFTTFSPLRLAPDEAFNHIRIDKALEFLIGDKLL